MEITRAQDKRMLQDQGRDPHVVPRNGSALFSQLPVKRRRNGEMQAFGGKGERAY